jgi:ribonuclease HI
MYSPHSVKVYTDGSALKNPGGPGGIAGIAEYPDALNREPERIFQEGFLATTNNRMELRACVEAIRFVHKSREAIRIARAIIITDSLYVYENAKRAPTWSANRWMNRDGRPIENKDLWNDFLRELTTAGARINLAWEPGKSRQILKDVDRAAKHAARNMALNVDRGFSGGKVAKRRTPGRTAATLFEARGQTVTLRVYRTAHRKLGRGGVTRLVFELFSETSNAFVAVYYAYAPAATVLHRNHCYKATFNENPRYPMVESLSEVEPCPGA